jgi:hypothetical protein
VFIFFDTFHDRRTGYYFITNPLGTQMDGRIQDDGRVTDNNWDAEWASAVRRLDDGWSAEFAIPLKALAFKPGEDQTWGFNVGRTRRSNLETSLWHGPVDNIARVSQAGEITGLHLELADTKRYMLIPYVQGSYQQAGARQGSAGIDIRYSLRPETLTSLTVNPDFAVIEADEEFVNLSRYEVRLDEKRPFFLETNARFQQRIPTFYSRRIQDIDVGGQLVSRNGPWDFTLLSARSPNVENPNAGPDENPLAVANYTAGRAEFGFLRSSTVALQAANRLLQGANSGSVSLDTSMHWTSRVNFTGQLVRAHGLYHRGNWAYTLVPSYDTRTSHIHFRYTHLGDRFADNANSTGFVQDDDRRLMESDFRKLFWIERGPVQKVEIESENEVFWSQQGVLRGYENMVFGQVETRSRWYFSGRYRNLYRLFEEGFHNDTARAEVGYNVREFNSVVVAYEAGRSYGSDLRMVGAEFRRKITRHLSVEYGLSRAWLDPDPDDKATFISVVRAQQNFKRDLHLKMFFQTNSAIDRRNIEIVCVWRHKPPFGQIQFAFQRGRAELGERSRQGNTFFVKISHVL